jgi:hypothetical protein
MTDYTDKTVWHACYTAVLSGALHLSMDRAQRPEAIAKLCSEIADAAARQAHDRWAPKPQGA